jgi:hypothetical protein
MKATLKRILLLCLILVPLTLGACLTRTAEFKNFSESIPNESYVVMHQDTEDNFQSFFPANTNPYGIRETNYIFTDYEKAKEMALKYPKSYIFKLCSKTVISPYQTTLEKIGK